MASKRSYRKPAAAMEDNSDDEDTSSAVPEVRSTAMDVQPRKEEKEEVRTIEPVAPVRTRWSAPNAAVFAPPAEDHHYVKREPAAVSVMAAGQERARRPASSRSRSPARKRHRSNSPARGGDSTRGESDRVRDDRDGRDVRRSSRSRERRRSRSRERRRSRSRERRRSRSRERRRSGSQERVKEEEKKEAEPVTGEDAYARRLAMSGAAARNLAIRGTNNRGGGGGAGGAGGGSRTGGGGGVCYDFQKGSCARGESCRYGHVKGGEDSGERRSVNVCYNFQKGACSNGDECRYSHDPNAKDSRPRQPDTLPALHSIHKGKVVKIMPFGAFIQIPGCRKHGLCHISQMASYKVEKVEDCVDEGSEMYVKVIAAESAEDGGNGGGGEGKLSYSFKYCNQSTGADLDPHLEQWAAVQNRGNASAGPRGPITLEAVVNATCTRCKGRGHVASDCFVDLKNKGSHANNYELLEDDAPRPNSSAPGGTGSNNVPLGNKIRDFSSAASSSSAAAADAGSSSGHKIKASASSIKNIQDAIRIIEEAKAAKKHKKEKKCKKDKKEKKSKKHKKHKKSSRHSDDSSSSSSDSD